MAVIRQGGNPMSGKVMTSMGLKDIRPPICNKCRERKEGQIYSRDANGNFNCEDCAGNKQKEMLKGSCDPEKCACGRVVEVIDAE